MLPKRRGDGILRRVAAPWSDIAQRIAARCAPSGLDLVQPFRVDWYNTVVDPTYRLPDLGRPDALGILIGNTRALWPLFLAALAADPSLRDAADPIERYTVDRVRSAVQMLAQRWEIRWAHEAPPRRVAIQRLAHLAGLAHLSVSGLNVHPRYGPWIALRAVVVVDVDGPPAPPPEPPNPCTDCAHACLPLFERAVAALREHTSDQPGLGETWRLWLAMRDACPVGREHRYGDDQIGYHYRKDRSVLS